MDNSGLNLEQMITNAVKRELGKDEKTKVTGKNYVVSKIKSCSPVTPDKEQIPIGISARHVHVTREVLDILYGKEYELTEMKELMGGQYAAKEQVTIVGANLRVIENVRILGPLRKETQIEVSKTDARKLGLNAPIRESGDVKGSMPITLVGPKGAVYLSEGCIVAMRHIHMNTDDAKRLGVKDKQIVSVATGEGIRKGVLSNVLIRVHPTYTLEMHIDTDEANGLGMTPKSTVSIMD